MNRLLLLAALMLLVVSSDGKTIVVDSIGKGDFKTISGALANAGQSDDIAVMPGKYLGATIDKSLSISGSGRVIINGQGSSALIISAPGCKISNLSIEGSGASPGVVVRSSDNILDRLLFSSGSTGLEISSSNNTVMDSAIDSGLGIKLEGSGCKVSNCTFKGDKGIKMEETSENIIQNCQFLTNTGMDISSSKRNRIEMNSLSGLSIGISLTRSQENLISGNHIFGSFNGGIDILEGLSNNISDNLVEGCKVGISLRQSDKNRLTNNTCRENERAGIYLNGSNENQLLENTPSGDGNGILLASSGKNAIISNTARGNTYGISLRGAGQNLLKNNSLCSNVYNLRISSVNEMEPTLSDFYQEIDPSNTVDGKPVFYLAGKRDLEVPEGCGFVGLIECQNVTVTNQSVSNSSSGVLLVGSTACRVRGCTFEQSESGLEFVNSQGIVVDMCRAKGCKIGLLSRKSSDILLRGIAASNCSDYGFKIDGGVNVSLKDSTAMSSRTGIAIMNAMQCQVANCSAVQNQEAGLELIKSQMCTLSRIVAFGNKRGIALSGSNTCEINEAVATMNSQDGLSLEQLSNAELRENTASQNGQGIYVQSSKMVQISKNNLSANQRHGLRMSSSSDCNITDNEFLRNQISGASLVDCQRNCIYHNIFVDNGFQNAADNGQNQWDAGPRAGGNYWSDHQVTGNPSDIPRQIQSSGTDKYPFQDPKGWS